LDLAIFFDITNYAEQWTLIEDRLKTTKEMCVEIKKKDKKICQPLLQYSLIIQKALYKRRDLVLNSVEHRIRRSVWKFATQAAQVLYGLCNGDCIKKFDFSINKLKKGKIDQMNILGENLRVLNI
jgi:hypothetical protein